VAINRTSANYLCVKVHSHPHQFFFYFLNATGQPVIKSHAGFTTQCQTDLLPVMVSVWKCIIVLSAPQHLKCTYFIKIQSDTLHLSFYEGL